MKKRERKRRRTRKMDWPTAANACDGPQIKKGALRLTRRENGAMSPKCTGIKQLGSWGSWMGDFDRL